MAVATNIPEAARRFLDGKVKGLWIDNAYVDATGDATVTAYDPSDQSELGVVQEASIADVDRAVRSARAALDGVWAAVWYDAVERSTGFARPGRVARFEDLDEALKPIAEAARPFYDRLAPYALGHA